MNIPPRPLRVASIPAHHPFVRVTWPSGVDLVADGASPHQGRALLDPARVTQTAAAADVVVVHFGYEWHEPGALRQALDGLADRGVGVVAVVHDLDNPHLVDQAPHRRLQDVLLRAADEVLTLTDEVADLLRARIGRPVPVLGHPSLLGDRPTTRRPGDTRTVGLFLSGSRPNVRVGEAVAALDRVAGAVVRPGVPATASVLVAGGAGDDAAELASLAANPHVDVVAARDRDDDTIAGWLGRLHALLLPYAWGTHSGWIAWCRDLGVHAVAPDGPAYRDQGASETWPRRAPGPGPMASAVAAALRRPRARPWTDAERRAGLAHAQSTLAAALDRAAAARRRTGSSRRPTGR